MNRRCIVDVPGLDHTNPIPMASIIGDLLVSGSIPARDPGTGAWDRDLPDECQLVVAIIRRTLDAAGGTPDDTLRVPVCLRDSSDKEPLSRTCLEMPPDPGSCPARHTLATPYMPAPQLIQCEITAVLN